MELKNIGCARLYRDRNYVNIEKEFPLVRAKVRKDGPKNYESYSPTDYRFFGLDFEIERAGQIMTLYSPVFHGPMLATILDRYKAKLDDNQGVVSPAWKWSPMIEGLVRYYAQMPVFANAEDYVGPLMIKGTDKFYTEGMRRFWVYLKREPAKGGQPSKGEPPKGGERYQVALGYNQSGDSQVVWTETLSHKLVDGKSMWRWTNRLYSPFTKQFAWQGQPTTHTASQEQTLAALQVLKDRAGITA